MTTLRRKLLLPVLAVVAALALAFGTTTVAHSAAAVTKAQVKKIAKKQATKVVKALAPGLSVGSAANASNLNGAPAATYLDRVAYASGGSIAVPSGGDNQLLGPLSLTVPPGVNFVRLDGAATFTGAGIGFGVYWAIDAACSNANAFAPGSMYGDTSGVGQGNGSVHVVLPVTAGVHQFRLCSNNAAGSAFSRSLMVQTVAVGATGGSTIARPAPSTTQPTEPGIAGR